MTTELVSDDEIEIVRLVRKFVDEQVRPVVNEFEHANTYPENLIDAMKEIGIFGLAIPEPWSEVSVSLPAYCLVTEELARGWMSLAGAMGGHTVVAKLILAYGTQEQKDRHLPRMATGELRATMALTEPGGGSDLQAMRTTARRDGDDYVVNGSKTWITNARKAELIVLMVKTDPAAQPRHKGVSILLVEKTGEDGLDGFHLSRDLPKLGYKGVESCEIAFDGMRVGVGNPLGATDRGCRFRPDDKGPRGGPSPGRLSHLRRRPGGSGGLAALLPRARGIRGTDLEAPVDWQLPRGDGNPSLSRVASSLCTPPAPSTPVSAPTWRPAWPSCSPRRSVCRSRSRDPGTRRLRLLDRVRCRALLPRRPAHDCRREHQRDSEERNRAAAHYAREREPGMTSTRSPVDFTTGDARSGVVQLAKSFLFVPGDRPERFDKAAEAGADAVIIDLEDAVSSSQKAKARAAAVDWLSGGGSACVRVNSTHSPSFEADVEALAGTSSLLGVVLPKADDPAAATWVARRTGAPVVALVESAAGMVVATSLAGAEGVARLAFGHLDYAVDLVADNGPTGMLHGRSLLVMASRAAGLAGPVDGVTVSLDDPTALADDIAHAALGMTGKLLIHPRHVEATHTAHRPSADAVSRAQKILHAVAHGDGRVVRVDSGMVDPPIVARARAILRRNDH